MKKQSINCTSTLVAYKNDIVADQVRSYSPMLYAVKLIDFFPSDQVVTNICSFPTYAYELRTKTGLQGLSK